MRPVLFFLLLFSSQALLAQTPNFNEFFKQKKTQIRYLVQQIVALQVYLEKLKDGYEIVDKGLNTIGQIRDGKFTMDKDYLASLRAVHPAVAGSPLLERIVSFNTRGLAVLGALEDDLRNDTNFTAAERDYVSLVRRHAAADVSARTDELTWLITPDAAEMSDDERLMHLEDLYRRCHRGFLFYRDFDHNVRLTGRQRAKEQHAVDVLRELYGIEK